MTGVEVLFVDVDVRVSGLTVRLLLVLLVGVTEVTLLVSGEAVAVDVRVVVRAREMVGVSMMTVPVPPGEVGVRVMVDTQLPG